MARECNKFCSPKKHIRSEVLVFLCSGISDGSHLIVVLLALLVVLVLIVLLIGSLDRGTL